MCTCKEKKSQWALLVQTTVRKYYKVECLYVAGISQVPEVGFEDKARGRFNVW